MTAPIKPIRSFVRRQGRITPSQKSALESEWLKYGLTADQVVDSMQVFGNSHPIWLEIGFGMGDAFVECAKIHPEANFVGIEVHLPGVGKTLRSLADQNVQNVRLFQVDAMEVMTNAILDNSLDRVQVFFPDPWPKARHHKRRLISNDFLNLVAQKLKPGGVLYLSTDWEDYANWMMDHLNAHSSFDNCFKETGFVPEEKRDRFQTKFERRGLKLGHGIWDLLFYKLH